MSAEKGWICDPPPPRATSSPPPPRDFVPGEDRKWLIMRDAGQFLTDKEKDALARRKADTQL